MPSMSPASPRSISSSAARVAPMRCSRSTATMPARGRYLPAARRHSAGARNGGGAAAPARRRRPQAGAGRAAQDAEGLFARRHAAPFAPRLLEWSHGLLEPRDRLAFRRLAVFPGSFSLDAAFAVAREGESDRWDILDSLGRLVDRSLVAIEQREPVRYRLLETGCGSLPATCSATAAMAVWSRSGMRGTSRRFSRTPSSPGRRRPTRTGIARYRPELDNLRAALDWALAEPERKSIALALGGSGRSSSMCCR